MPSPARCRARPPRLDRRPDQPRGGRASPDAGAHRPSLPALSGTPPSAAVWSSDGRSLAFLWNDRGRCRAREVWIVARDGTGLRRLSPEAGPTPGGVSELAWVPGKAELIYVAGGGLFRIAASGGAPARPGASRWRAVGARGIPRRPAAGVARGRRRLAAGARRGRPVRVDAGGGAADRGGGGRPVPPPRRGDPGRRRGTAGWHRAGLPTASTWRCS